MNLTSGFESTSETEGRWKIVCSNVNTCVCEREKNMCVSAFACVVIVRMYPWVWLSVRVSKCWGTRMQGSSALLCQCL